MYHPGDLVFVRSGMYVDALFRNIQKFQPMAECHILGAGEDLKPFLVPYTSVSYTHLHQSIETYQDVELTEDSRMTLGEWLDRWLDEYKAGTIRHSTMYGYRQYARRCV